MYDYKGRNMRQTFLFLNMKSQFLEPIFSLKIYVSCADFHYIIIKTDLENNYKYEKQFQYVMEVCG